MSINPRNPDHRQRLSRALSHSYQEIKRYNNLRANTIRAYLGVSEKTLGSLTNRASTSTQDYERNLPKGNLLQLSGLSHQIALAYGEPRWYSKARTPENAGLADTLGPALNRMSALLDLGETHRNVAADSYFGYGIFKVGIGFMPAAAQIATGLEIGPCVWRVGQNQFIYDMQAESWNAVGYVGDTYFMPLNDAQKVYPDQADRLQGFTDIDRLDAATVIPRSSRLHHAEEMVQLVDLYFPREKKIATWPVRGGSFSTVVEEPLTIRDYEGHWSGVYQVLTHLYSPDDLVPIAQAESVKSMHFLFNDILKITSDQARAAKINPMYRGGSDADMRKIFEAPDRYPVGVQDPTALQANFEIPGPTQSQTAYLAAMLNLFRELTPTFDEPERAPTAAQGTLERETTNAIIAEARRRDTRVLQLVGYKLGYLLLNNNEITLPASRPLRPGSNIPLDVSFRPGPRSGRIDDFDIAIEPYSTRYRSPEQRMQQVMTSIQIIGQMMEMKANGAPINIEAIVKSLAEGQDLPELLEMVEEADPLDAAKRSQSRRTAPRLGVGQYTTTSVSEKSTAGALESNLNQAGSDNGATPRMS